jgi:uncharacterized protein (DUF58 family)
MKWLYSLIPFLTMKGRILLIITAGILLAGVNTGNNLLYLIFSTILAVLTVSYLAAGYLLRFIHLRMRFPLEIYAGEEFALSLIVDNRKGKMPVATESFKIFSGKKTLDHSRVLDKEPDSEQDLHLALPGKQCRGNRFMRIPRRGLYHITRLQVMVTCPLGFVQRRLKRDVNYEVTVYPEMKQSEIVSSKGHRLPLWEGTGGREGNGDLFNIRDYIEGDDSRFIDWKSTAKLGRFMTKEMRGGESNRITVYFDRSVGPHFETRISKAAWLCDFFLSNGYELRFVSDDLEIPPEQGSSQRKEILTYLSTVQPSDQKISLKQVPYFLRDSRVFVIYEEGEMGMTSDGRRVATEQKK